MPSLLYKNQNKYIYFGRNLNVTKTDLIAKVAEVIIKQLYGQVLEIF